MRQLVALLPAAAVLALVTRDLDAVWWSFVIAEFMSLTVSLICLRRLHRKDLAAIRPAA